MNYNARSIQLNVNIYVAIQISCVNMFNDNIMNRDMDELANLVWSLKFKQQQRNRYEKR